MEMNEASDLVRQTLVMALLIASPMLVIGLVVGLIVSLVQAVTQIQEQTLTSASSLILLHRLPNNRFGVFLCSPDEHLGRLRYELKRSLLYSTLSNL